MKFLILLLLLHSQAGFSSPRLDTAVGTPDPNIITVVPDSTDVNLYYLFPQRFGVATDTRGRQRFLYQEYREGFFTTLAAVEIVFTPLFDKELVDAKIKSIKAQNPKAVFTFVPVVQSKVDVPSILFPAIEKSDCGIQGMVIGQDIVCHQTIKDDGRDVYVERFRKGLLNVFQLNYRFAATVNGQALLLDHSIAMYGGGIDDSSYYLDRKGQPLKVANQKRLFQMIPLESDEIEKTWIDLGEASLLWGI